MQGGVDYVSIDYLQISKFIINIGSMFAITIFMSRTNLNEQIASLE